LKGGGSLVNGSLTDHASASITGGYWGVDGGSATTVTNYGSLVGTKYEGVGLFGGGFVSNAAAGSVTGARNGIIIEDPGTVLNSGSIAGAGSSGVVLGAGGYVSNAAGGSISGFFYGVAFEVGQAILVNSGQISQSATVTSSAAAVLATDSNQAVTNTAS